MARSVPIFKSLIATYFVTSDPTRLLYIGFYKIEDKPEIKRYFEDLGKSNLINYSHSIMASIYNLLICHFGTFIS